MGVIWLKHVESINREEDILEEMIKAMVLEDKTWWTISSRLAPIRDDKIGVKEDSKVDELVDTATILGIEICTLAFWASLASLDFS